MGPAYWPWIASNCNACSALTACDGSARCRSATLCDAFPALAPLEAALRDNLALLEGYAAGGDKAADIASALIAAKRA